SWIDGCAFASYAAIKALDTARNVSAQCGEMTVEVQGRSLNIGWDTKRGGTRRSESVNFQRRPQRIGLWPWTMMICSSLR
ncbi:type IV secretory system conjugative DNA transfer family protein, partial [Rhizobium leguminosarum]|uniref:type IV secretory system conjugative DNA transfer family protein n=1 Tax=Rhizobium leguminosarum TaxID=384 RepID=UPI003F9A7CCC